MKRYIIFDLDSTLVESETIIWNKILKEISEYKKEYLETARYCWKHTSGLGYRQFLELIFTQVEDVNYMENKVKEILQESHSWISFYPWAIQTIENLSKNYLLFLSTWNYTSVATDILTRWGVLKYFAHVQWSESIPKSSEHIEIFKDITMDPDFEKFTLSVGDGETEKEIARKCGIDFIQIWPDGHHTHTLPSVADLEKYLHHFTNTKTVEVDEQNYML